MGRRSKFIRDVKRKRKYPRDKKLKVWGWYVLKEKYPIPNSWNPYSNLGKAIVKGLKKEGEEYVRTKPVMELGGK